MITLPQISGCFRQSRNAFLFVYFILSAILLPKQTFSQDNFFKKAAPPSANAASLGKFGDTPVSYHTGVPEISIPIYTVKQGSLSVPVTLRYHSSGIRVDELPSWVGLGWALDVGGVITRHVVGAADEGGIGRSATALAQGARFSWYKDYGVSPLISTYCVSHPGGVLGEDPNWDDCRWRNLDVAHGLSDTEPDMFNFNVGGFSGKFFLDSHRQPVMQPLQDIVIKPTGPTNTPFDTWVIITPDGTHYYFGDSLATEKTYFGVYGEASTNSGSYSSSSWYLTKIVNLNKTDSIMFTYQSQEYSSFSPQAHSVQVGPDIGYISGSLVYGPTVPNITFVKSKVPSTITTSAGLVTVNLLSTTLREDVRNFEANTNTSSTLLDGIQILSPDYETNFQFGYSYFNSGTEGEFHDNKRLRLNTVTETTPTQTKPPYLFTYNNSQTLPNRLSFATDHWGYYNGETGNTGRIPSLPSSEVYVGGGGTVLLGSPGPLTLANRTPSKTYMKSGILTKIQYPTGGETEFQYEPHRENQADSNAIVGGLRIKSIIDRDGTGVPVKKTFTYSNGKLYSGAPNYVTNMNSNPTSIAYYVGGNFFGTMINSETRPALKTTSGYHIGYTQVTVVSSNGGYSTYEYINPDPTSASYDYPPKPTPMVPGAGQLINESHYDKNDIAVRTVANTYELDFSEDVYALKIVAGQVRSGGGGGELPIILSYTINTGRFLLIKKSESGDGVTTNTFYRYSPNHNSPIQTSTYDSEGKRIDQFTFYSKDKMIGSGCKTGTFASALGTYHSNVKTLFDQYVTGSSTSYTTSLDAESVPFHFGTLYATYKGCVAAVTSGLSQAELAIQKMMPDNIIMPVGSRTKVAGTIVAGDSTNYKVQSNFIIPYERFELNPKTSTMMRRTSIAFDANDRIKFLKKENDVTTSYSWKGYKSTLMTAEVQNATPEQILYEGFEDQAYSAHVASYAKTGRKSYYDAAYTVHLPSAGTYKLTYWSMTGSGAPWLLTETTISADTNIGGSNIYVDEIRLHPVGALMTTYSYDPGAGVTSVTDANNLTTYYTYDSFGRLILVKDFNGNIVKQVTYNYKQ